MNAKERKTDRWGIDQSYQDGRGEWHEVPAATKNKLLEAMQTSGLAEPEEPELEFVEQGTVPKLHPGARLVLEDGAELSAEEAQRAQLPLGYHSVRGDKGSRRLIVAPRQCYLPQDLHVWGWALQLYSLRSQQSWGMGDLGDLKSFAGWAKSQGAGIIMTNPLNAASPGIPQQASPYSPTSRIYRNLLFLRVQDVPGAREAGVNLDRFSKSGERLNSKPLIDRDEIYKLKLEALSTIWEHVRNKTRFEPYEKEQGEQLDRFANYCVLAERYGPNWREWPNDFQHPASPAIQQMVQADAERIRFHKWIQFLLEQQLSGVCGEPMIMQDLPIGVDPSGADAWALQDLFAQGVSVGAPPDVFNTQGQDWGLQPFIPHKLRAAYYEPFVRIVRSAMKNSMGLRIDHVMGLFRLFWIPQGEEKRNGTYVRYRYNELLAILALESVRAKAFVVGEDLGTVEEGVREALGDRAVLSYRVMWFEEQPPETYPERALAAITTHDLPTIAGLWSGADVAEQTELKLKPNREGLQKTREALKKLTGTTDADDVREVIVRAHRELGKAPSAVVIAAVEDALAMEKRPNLPGTLPDQRLNWSMPLTKSFEEIQTDELIRRVADAVQRGRGEHTEGNAQNEAV